MSNHFLGLALLISIVATTVQGFGCAIAFFPNIRREVLFPLRAMTSNATVIDGIARVSVTQYFETVTTEKPPETWNTRYEIPFDEQGAIYEFKASYNDRIIKGVVKSDEAAKKEFDDAINSGKPAFLGTAPNAGIFKVEFGNVPLNVLLKVEFVYVAEVQARDRETLRFVVPATLAPEMNPAVTTRPGSGFQNGAFILNVKAYSSTGLISASSPTHNVTVADVAKDTKQISLTDFELKRRDVVIILKTKAVQKPEFKVFEESGQDGSTALMVSLLPDTSSFVVNKVKTEYIFIVDRSGSMSYGNKILQASKALVVVLQNLPSGSLFNFVSFGTNYEFAFEKSQSIDDRNAFEQGLTFAKAIEANFGETNIIGPIKAVLGKSPTPGIRRVLLVLTDGEVSNTNEVIKYVGKSRGSTRVFSLGIGEADRELVNGIARSGGGTSEFVDSSDLSQIPDVALKQVEVITQSAFWVAFKIDWGNSTSGVVAPYGRSTVFADRRAIFYYLTNTPVNYVAISASVGGQVDVRYQLPKSNFIDPADLNIGATKIVGPMAAREAIRDLEEGRSRLHAINENPNPTAIKNEIIRIGVKYQIASTETSFIAVDNKDWTSRNAVDSPAPSPPLPGGGFCFSGISTVLTKDRGQVRMNQIQIGDVVYVGHNKYSRVYSFGHRNDMAFAEFLQLHTDDHTIETTSDHMVFVENLGAIPASIVEVGDNLVLGNGNPATVTKITTVKRQGAYAPFTEAGTIVVNGIIASNYISLQKDSAFFRLGSFDVVSMHTLAHAFQATHRMACDIGLCRTETYTVEGVSTWVYGPFLASKWLIEQDDVVIFAIGIPVIVAGVLMYVFESLYAIALFLSLAMAAVMSFTYHSSFTNRRRKKSAM